MAIAFVDLGAPGQSSFRQALCIAVESLAAICGISLHSLFTGTLITSPANRGDLGGVLKNPAWQLTQPDSGRSP